MIHNYKNGNVWVSIDTNDGTKIRMTNDDEFRPEFPESIDINLTQYCTGGCPFCYAECSTAGVHGDIMGAKFVDTLRSYTEVALQVNDLTHPDLVAFLEKLKAKKVLTSITVNQRHFEEKEDIIADWIDKKLIYGLGISLVNPTDAFVVRVSKYPNAVIHVINGIATPKDFYKLGKCGLKVLILGYKDKGRGHEYLENNRKEIEENQTWLVENIEKMIKANWFEVISFDNLSLAQLDIKHKLPPEYWDEIFQGEEGSNSMFINLVDGTFGVSSLVPKTEMMPLMDDITEMFKKVREVCTLNKENSLS